MSWAANPLNLLVVDSTHRQPDFVGWYGYNNDLLNTTGGLRLGKGLKLGKSQATNVVRNGNGNDTLTLSAGQAITSHPKTSGKYNTSIPATPGTVYTLGLTATGINPQRTSSRTKFSILWINAAGDVISETSQGIISAFNLSVRNWVIGEAPENTVGMVVFFSADHSVTLAYPTLCVGREDIRKGDPISSDTVTPSTNLFFYDPESSAIPWKDGWINESGAKIAPTSNILNVAANTEARLYFREDADTPTTMGIQIQSGGEYFFAITESPSRTAATVTLKAYDLTGTQLLGTYVPVVSGNRLRFSFQAPIGAVWLAIKIKAVTTTSFIDPVLVPGLNDPGDMPVYGNFQEYFQFISDVRKTVSVRTEFLSENLIAATKNVQFLSDNLQKVAINSVQLRSDNLTKITKSFEFRSDNTISISRRFEFQSDNSQKVNIQSVFLADSLQKVTGGKTWQLRTDSAQKFTKSFVVLTDTVQIVGQRSYQGGLSTAQDLLTDEDLMTKYSTRRPTRSWVFSADLTIGVGTDFVFLSDIIKTVGKNYVLLSDTTNHVVRGVIFASDNNETLSWRFTFKSDTIGPVGAIEFVLVTDNAQKVQKNFVLTSDVLKELDMRYILKSDTTHRISRRFLLRSSVNGKRRTIVVTSRPLNHIGA